MAFISLEVDVGGGVYSRAALNRVNTVSLLHGLAVNTARYCTSVQKYLRGKILHTSAMSRHIDR